MQYEADKSFLIERNSLEIASNCGIFWDSEYPRYNIATNIVE